MATEEIDISEPPHSPTVKNVTKTFLGEIFGQTCTIASEGNDIIKFANIFASNLESGTASTSFNVVLNDCPPVDSAVSLHFAVPKDKVHNDLLMNNYATEEHRANVKIKISSGDQQILLGKPEGEQRMPEQNMAMGQPVTFSFVAEYVKDAETVTPGGVQAQLPISILYK